MTKKILGAVVAVMFMLALLTVPAASSAPQSQAKSVAIQVAASDQARYVTNTETRAEAAQRASRALHARVYKKLHKAPPARSKSYARFYIKYKYNWKSTQFRCLVKLWEKESGWRYNSDNGDNGRTWGVPQAFPGSKMASEGSDWRTNTATQIRWGAKYIKKVYGTPCYAWQRWQERAGSGSYGWY